jgi:hypothetical protein
MVLFFWVLTPCRLVGRCQRFGGTYYLCLQGQRQFGDSMFIRNVGINLESTRRQNPKEDHCHRRENLSSHSHTTECGITGLIWEGGRWAIWPVNLKNCRFITQNRTIMICWRRLNVLLFDKFL